MRYLITFVLVIGIIATFAPPSAGDLDAWNNGTSATINVGVVNIGTTNVVGALNGKASTTSPTITTGLTITNGSTGSDLVINGNSANTYLLNFNIGGTDFGGLTNNGQFLLSAGTAARPAIAWLADNDGTGTGFFRTSPSAIGVSINGAENFTFAGADLYFESSSGRVIIGTGSASTAVTLERDGAAGVLQIQSDAASPTAAVVKAADGSGTDKNGGNFTGEGGQSTGTGTSGYYDIATALSGESSASTANPYSIRWHAKAKYVALTHATATEIEKFSLAANKIRGGTITALCYATNSTPHLQALTSVVSFQAVAVSTTITATISQVDSTTAADSGTLTCAYTIVDNGDNTFSIKANANSSLSSPTERCKLVITGMSGNAAVTITDP